MKRITSLFFFICFFTPFIISQTSLSGVINHYAKVTAIDSNCQSKLTVDDTTGFELGMNVILIQVKGVMIDESNAATFGDVLDLGTSGLYEKNEIDSMSATCIFLKYQLLNNYDVNEKVQVVTMPKYQNAVVTDVLTAAPWDGDKGGVVAFSVQNDLVLNENIDASGKGFRGGVSVSVNPNNCNFAIQQNDFFYDLNNWRGAEKGEGAARFISTKEAGKGAQFNGGGGGNDHNAGGGGGSNISFGGQGGDNNEPSFFGCKGLHPGLGGKNVGVDSSRIFLGGGGGAGHGNNDVGTNGGNGGGIVIVETDNIMANGFKIISNGDSGTDTSGDGAGGGGSGGTVVLQANAILDDLVIDAIGGNGGSIDNEGLDRCFGPGGGGGGGRLLVSTWLTSWTLNNNGGTAGLSTNSSSCGASNNNAENGSSGISLGQFGIPESYVENGLVAIENQPVSKTVCVGADTSFTVNVLGSNIQYQWQFDNGNGIFQNVDDGGFFSGAMTDSLIILNPNSVLEGWLFQCLITTDCATLTSDTASLEILSIDFVTVNPASLFICEDSTASIKANAFGTYTQISYQWQVDEGSGFFNLIDDLTYFNTNGADLGIAMVNSGMDGFFFRCVITYDCGTIESDVIQLNVESIPTAQFDFVANGGDVDFNNLSSFNSMSYLWDFGDNSMSDEVDPSHIYTQSGIYTVQLIAYNSCGSDTIFQDIEVTFLAPPDANFTLDNGMGCAPLLVQFMDQSSGVIDSWLWSFPGGTPNSSTEQNPQILYENPGTFDVTLEVTNSAGSNEIHQEDFIVVDLPIFAGFDYVVNENEVTFINSSQNATFFQWDFGDNSAESTEQNPIHQYAQPGIYMVTLVATNPLCGSAITQVVEVVFTSTEEINSKATIEVFPNPVVDQLTVKFQKRGQANTIKIYHQNGKLVYEKDQFYDEKINIDLSDLPAGMYFLQALNERDFLVESIVKY